jgi:hypothetical protein
MSFSFRTSGASKAAVLAAVQEQLDSLVKTQPPHAVDAPLVTAAAKAYVDLLPEPDENQVIRADIAGSLGGTWAGDEIQSLTSVNLSVTFNLRPKA